MHFSLQNVRSRQHYVNGEYAVAKRGSHAESAGKLFFKHIFTSLLFRTEHEETISHD